ncbi:MAG: hypothetical protein R3C44_11380 [Chloroflexota bacterium]
MSTKKAAANVTTAASECWISRGLHLPDATRFFFMPRRIYETYSTGDQVEIIFSNRGDDTWQPATVLRREPPGIWVQTADGRQWFMTNTYRIRRREDTDSQGPNKRGDR